MYAKKETFLLILKIVVPWWKHFLDFIPKLSPGGAMHSGESSFNFEDGGVMVGLSGLKVSKIPKLFLFSSSAFS